MTPTQIGKMMKRAMRGRKVSSHSLQFPTEHGDFHGEFHVLEAFPRKQESQEQREKDPCLRRNEL